MACFAASFRMTSRAFRPKYTRPSWQRCVLVRQMSGLRQAELAKAREVLGPIGAGNVELSMDNETGIATVTLQQPDKKNALSGLMMVQLSDVVAELERWREGRGLVLRSEGDFFCSGGDLTLVGAISNPADGRLMCTLMQDTTTRLHRLPLVSVCLVHGRAIGGGAELVTATDFRLFTQRASVQFVQGVMGVATGWGGGTRLVRLVGPREAMDLLLTARRCEAEEALKLGLADLVLKTDDPYEETKSWLQSRVKFAPEVVAALKNIVLGAANTDLRSSLENEKENFVPLWGGPINSSILSKNIKH